MTANRDWIDRELPPLNAKTVISKRQRGAGILLVLLLAVALLVSIHHTLLLLNVVATALYLIFSHYKLALHFLSLPKRQRDIPLDDLVETDLPTYTVMIPLYREAKAVPGLVAHLAKLDYPREKLQIILLVEEDDAETQAALAALPGGAGPGPLPQPAVPAAAPECSLEELQEKLTAASRLEPPFEILIVPMSFPRTKPKACNYGLKRATGEYLVIYDAEDRPETDQLKKAAYLFSLAAGAESPPAGSETAPEETAEPRARDQREKGGEPGNLICLQAHLNYYNRDRNLLTRLFTVEYSCWFDYCLVGLLRLDAPIPLGGTSNHFRLSVLRELKGWDPYNVTEDCDLGIRLYIRGYRTGLLDSTTWEEATFRIMPWIRQRSRWIKGYLQTYLVHLRQQSVLLRDMGLGGTLHFHFLFGATCFCLLLNPFYWFLTCLWFFTRSEYISGFFPIWVMLPALISFIAGNAAFVLSGMLGCLQRRYYHLVPYCLLMPLYWVLMSVAAWKGALQLITNPFYWEKTPHEGTG